MTIDSSQTTVLKRKRPAKIEIPIVLREIQAENTNFTSQDCSTAHVSFTGDGAGVFSIKGKKSVMEDSYKIVSFSRGDTNKRFFGVYDGHGGKKAAEFVSENLHTNIVKMIEDRSEGSTIEEAVKEGYLKTDQDFLNQGLGSGACCVTALIEGKQVIVSNLGDCRAVVCRGGVAEALTTDHRADQEDEMKRIENTGGYVGIHGGSWRVSGTLAVSRSIGDATLKKWIVAEPDTKILHLDPDMEFLLLASDGLWDKVGNQEAIDTVKRICFDGKKLEMSGDLHNESDSCAHGIVSSSLSPKLKRISLVKPQKTMTVDCINRSEDGFVFKNDWSSPRTPSSKLHKIAVLESPRAMNQSPNHKKSHDCWYRTDDDFASQNDSPPLRARRIALFERENLMTHSPRDENGGPMKKPDNGGPTKKPDSDSLLVSACKELAKLAVKRGSLDDITVMIIDLRHFQSIS